MSLVPSSDQIINILCWIILHLSMHYIVVLYLLSEMENKILCIRDEFNHIFSYAESLSLL